MHPIYFEEIEYRLKTGLYTGQYPVLLKYDVPLASEADLEWTLNVIATLWMIRSAEWLSFPRIARDVETINLLVKTQNVSRVTLVHKRRIDLSVSFKLEFNFTYAIEPLRYEEELQKLLNRYEEPVGVYDEEIAAMVIYEGVTQPHPWLTYYARPDDARRVIPEIIS